MARASEELNRPWRRRSKRSFGKPRGQGLPTSRSSDSLLDRALQEFEDEDEGSRSGGVDGGRAALLEDALDEFDGEADSGDENEKGGDGGELPETDAQHGRASPLSPDLDAMLDDALNEFDDEEVDDDAAGMEVGGEAVSSDSSVDDNEVELISPRSREGPSRSPSRSEEDLLAEAREARRREVNLRQRAVERRERSGRRRKQNAGSRRRHRIFEMAPDQASHMKEELLEQADREDEEENGEQLLSDLDKVSAEVTIARRAVEEIRRHHKDIKRQLSAIDKANRMRRPRSSRTKVPAIIPEQMDADSAALAEAEAELHGLPSPTERAEQLSNADGEFIASSSASSEGIQGDPQMPVRRNRAERNGATSASDKHTGGLVRQIEELKPQLKEAEEVLGILCQRRGALLKRQKERAEAMEPPADAATKSSVPILAETHTEGASEGMTTDSNSPRSRITHNDRLADAMDEAAQHTGALYSSFSKHTTEILSSIWDKRPLVSERKRKVEAQKQKKTRTLLKQAGLTEEEADAREVATKGLATASVEVLAGPPKVRSAWEERINEKADSLASAKVEGDALDTAKARAETKQRSDAKAEKSRREGASAEAPLGSASTKRVDGRGDDSTVDWYKLAEELTLLPADVLAKRRKSESEKEDKVAYQGKKKKKKGRSVAFSTEANTLVAFDEDQPPQKIHDEKYVDASIRKVSEADLKTDDSRYRAIDRAIGRVVQNENEEPIEEQKAEDEEEEEQEEEEEAAEEEDEMNLVLSLHRLEKTPIGSDLHALWRGALPSERDWDSLEMGLPELATIELDQERQVYDMLRSHKPVEGMVLLELGLMPDKMRDFAISAHAFVRFWAPHRRYFVKERCFRDTKSSEFVMMLCCSLRDVHIAHLASVLSVLWLFTLLPNHRRTVLRDGAVGVVTKRMRRHKGKFRAVELSALTLVCSVLWSPDKYLLKKKRRAEKERAKQMRAEERRRLKLEAEATRVEAEIQNMAEAATLPAHDVIEVVQNKTSTTATAVSVVTAVEVDSSEGGRDDAVLEIISDESEEVPLASVQGENVVGVEMKQEEANEDEKGEEQTDTTEKSEVPSKPDSPTKAAGIRERRHGDMRTGRAAPNDNLLDDEVGRAALAAKEKKRAARELRRKRRNEERASRSQAKPTEELSTGPSQEKPKKGPLLYEGFVGEIPEEVGKRSSLSSTGLDEDAVLRTALSVGGSLDESHRLDELKKKKKQKKKRSRIKNTAAEEEAAGEAANAE